MRRTNPNIGRGARRTGWDFGPHMETDHAAAEQEAAAGIAAAQLAESLTRVSHPVVRTTHDSWFRVIREYMTRDGVCIEDIFEAPTFDAARQIARTEIGRARVLSPFRRGRVSTLYDNLQPIESRA